MLLGAAPGILIFAPLIKDLFSGLALQQIGAVMAVLALLLGLLAPLVDVLTQRLALPLFTLASAILFMVIASFAAGFDSRHPRPDNLFYAVDGSTGNALWLSRNKTLDEWTGSFFPATLERRKVPVIFGDESMD
jgi:hypothetical protein